MTPHDAYVRERYRTISQAFAELADAYTPPSSAIPIRRGDNLFSRMELENAGTVFELEAGFEQDGDAPFERPMRIQAAREAVIQQQPILRGQHTITAALYFEGIRFEGTNRDQAIVHLWNLDGPGPLFAGCTIKGSPNGQKRGVHANGTGGRFENCWIGNIWHTNDAQAIYGDDGTNGLRVMNCHLEASGEVVMFGGGDPRAITGIPQDIEISGCTLTRPLDWRGRPDMTVKNLFELKNAQRVTLRDCTLENSWANGQTGYGLVLTVRNQDGTAPFTTIEDVLITGNTFRHTGSGIMVDGRDDRLGVLSAGMRRVRIEGNTFEDIDPVWWGGDGRQIYIKGGPEQLWFRGNTFSGKNLNSAFYFDGDPLVGFVVQDHRAMEGNYGLFRDGGTPGAKSLDDSAIDPVWQNVTLVRTVPENVGIKYPAGTTVVDL